MKFKFRVDFIQNSKRNWKKFDRRNVLVVSLDHPALSQPNLVHPMAADRSFLYRRWCLYIRGDQCDRSMAMRWSPLRTLSRKGRRWRKEIHPFKIYENYNINVNLQINVWPLRFHSIRLLLPLWIAAIRRPSARLRHSRWYILFLSTHTLEAGHWSLNILIK